MCLARLENRYQPGICPAYTDNANDALVQARGSSLVQGAGGRYSFMSEFVAACTRD